MCAMSLQTVRVEKESIERRIDELAQDAAGLLTLLPELQHLDHAISLCLFVDLTIAMWLKSLLCDHHMHISCKLNNEQPC